MERKVYFSRLLDFYGGLLPEKQQACMFQYYYDDLSLAEVSENLGITRQGVRDFLKRGEAALEKVENELKLIARIELTNKKLTDLKGELSRRGSHPLQTSRPISRSRRRIPTSNSAASAVRRYAATTSFVPNAAPTKDKILKRKRIPQALRLGMRYFIFRFSALQHLHCVGKARKLLYAERFPTHRWGYLRRFKRFPRAFLAAYRRQSV